MNYKIRDLMLVPARNKILKGEFKFIKGMMFVPSYIDGDDYYILSNAYKFYKDENETKNIEELVFSLELINYYSNFYEDRADIISTGPNNKQFFVHYDDFYKTSYFLSQNINGPRIYSTSLNAVNYGKVEWLIPKFKIIDGKIYFENFTKETDDLKNKPIQIKKTLDKEIYLIRTIDGPRIQKGAYTNNENTSWKWLFYLPEISKEGSLEKLTYELEINNIININIGGKHDS